MECRLLFRRRRGRRRGIRVGGSRDVGKIMGGIMVGVVGGEVVIGGAMDRRGGEMSDQGSGVLDMAFGAQSVQPLIDRMGRA